jgi:hypothetical protein
MLLSVAVLGLAVTPAMADPLRGDFRSKAADYGRGETREFGAAKPETHRVERDSPRPSAERMIHQEPAIPIRAEIALKMQHGDNREGNAAQHKVDVQSSGQRSERMIHEPPALPIKTQIMLKMNGGGDSREGSNTSSQKGMSKDHKNESPFSRKPLSFDEKVALCQQTGVCLPLKMNMDDEK